MKDVFQLICDRYTPTELVEKLEITVDELVEYLEDFIEENINLFDDELREFFEDLED